MVSVVSRDVIDLSKPFGPVFWGIIFNLIFFGMSLCQALNYFRTAGKDRAFVKFAALGMIVLVISVTWTDLVVDFGGMAQFMGTNTQIGVECVISACIAFLAQMYFVSQICHVKPAGVKGNCVLYSVVPLTSLFLVFGLACAAVMLMNQMTPHYNLHFQLVFGGAKGANAAGIASTSNLLDALSTLFMNRGAAVTLLQIFTFIMFFAFENPQYWLAPHLLLTKMYVNTFFAILNSRQYLREKHLGTFVSSLPGSTQVAKNSHSFTSSPMAFAPNRSVIGTVDITKEGHDQGRRRERYHGLNFDTEPLSPLRILGSLRLA
ncbi:hypothetical protein B0H14DRAFT_3459962 [Mycena olivaceomarginata]|nr:hypothetical protein B0H14DRAFT_3459962 [Mycena olivaceomarginata]